MQRVPLTPRQKDILEFFDAYQRRTGISPTLDEIAKHMGVNKVTIFGHVAELEKKGVLVRRAKRASRSLQIVEADTSVAPPAIPLLGTIAAGAPISVFEAPETLDLSPFLRAGRDVYALRVRGNSMIEASICDGDVVLLERRTSPRNGEIVVAVLPNEEATLKRFYREGGRVRLQPANGAMNAIVVDEVEVRGILVGVIRGL